MKGATWALVTVVATSGCGGGTTVVSLPPPEVSVSQPVQRELSDYFDTTGRAAAVENVEIRARVAGYLMKVDFEDGQLVKAGDVLFEIDARPYEAAVMEAQGELARWHASLTKAEADVARTQRLLSKGAASEKDFESAVADRDRAKAEIQASEAKLAQAKLDLGFTKVTAPVDGQVSKTNLTVGNLVSPGTAGSAPLTTLVSVAPVYVYFDIDERTLLRARAQRRDGATAAAPLRSTSASSRSRSRSGSRPKRATPTKGCSISSTIASTRRRAPSRRGPPSPTPTGPSRPACSCGSACRSATRGRSSSSPSVRWAPIRATSTCSS